MTIQIVGFEQEDPEERKPLFTKVKEPLKVSTIVEYYKIYQTYLLDHDLQDDTNSITVDQLVDFVENHILNE